MLVGGILMIKLVLHEASQLAEFGNVLAEKIHVVHSSQNGRNVPALIENFQECFPNMFVMEELAIHQGQFLADQLREIRVELETPLLGVEKDAHEAAGLVPEDAACRGAKLAINDAKAVNDLLFSLTKAFRNQAP